MLDRITIFFQENKKLLIAISLALVTFFSSVFFFKFNSFAVGYSSKMLLFLGVLSALLIMLFYFVYEHFNKKENPNTLPRFYFALLLILGTMYSAVFLPGSAPDEPYHYESAYYYSNIITGNTNEDALIMMRQTDIEFEEDILSNQLTKENYQITRQAFTVNPASLSYEQTTIEGPNQSLPQTRLFAAIGLSLGQLFGLNGLMTFYLGRLFNFLCFALLAFAAYKITPIGKTLFATITLLPMTLHIASSFSYDATIIGLSLLLISLCLNGIYSVKKCSRSLLIAIPIVTFLLAPCKVLYSLSAFLVFLIPNSNFHSKKVAYLYKFGLLGIALIAVCLFKLPHLFGLAGISASESSTTSNVDSRGIETGQFYSLSDLIANPLHTMFIFANTINQKFDFYLSSFLGESLGWFQPELKTPWFFILFFLFLLFYTARKSDKDSTIPSKTIKYVFGVLSGLMFIAVLSSMLLGWTFNTELSIEGVQGRYFLPFAPLIFLLFRTKNTRRNESSSPLVLLTLFALNAMNLIYIWAAMARI